MSEREALIELFHATDGKWWLVKWNWASRDERHSKWHGLTVDTAGHVKAINLRGNRLRGNMQSLRRLCALVNAELLCLVSNEISGSIPDGIGSLSNLHTLDLSWNSLSGPIPDSLYDLHGLRILKLEHNALSGEVSARLGELTQLVHLDLSHNQLCGYVPKVAHLLPKLAVVNFSHNQFSGCSPTYVREFLSWSKSENEVFHGWKSHLHVRQLGSRKTKDFIAEAWATHIRSFINTEGFRLCRSTQTSQVNTSAASPGNILLIYLHI